MSGTRRGWMLLVVLVALMIGGVRTAAAQVATTTVQDTVYSANGTPASGTVLVSWSTFTTAGGQTVPAGNTSATISAGGLLSIALAPNAGATPMGSYYTAVFHLSDGTTSREYWVIPVTVPGGGTVTLAAITNQVLPISVAMQTVSKQYVDQAIAAASTGFPLATSPYVQKVGDTMTGPLVLPADPVSPNQAADKNYVDENAAATSAGLGQKVSLLPTATQAVAQPSGTSFSISGTSASTTFSGTGTVSQATITSANTAASPNTGSYNLFTNDANCFQSGYDLGNNGTSAQGWSVCTLDASNFQSATRGITQMNGGTFSHFAQGDTAFDYGYMSSFGGTVAASDEGVTHTVKQAHQIGYYTGVIATGGVTGSNLLTTTSFTCHGMCTALSGNQFADGGILLDTSKGGSTATLASTGSALNGTYYTLASGTVPVSTAWGNIVPSSCTNNGNGQWQNYTATTCNVTLGSSPASPGNFVAGTDVCLAGPFQEEAAVTAVGTPASGVQSITFNTRYAWDGTNGNTNAALVMQGGACGQSLVATSAVSSWPIAYAVVGATSSTQVFFSNCVVGGCNGSGNIIPGTPVATATVINYGASIVRASNVVTVSGFMGYPFYFPAGSTVIVTGATPTDLNGTFTVLTNSEDSFNPSMTWAQTGANESSTTDIVMRAPNTSVTFFPSAFITGTNSGVGGDAQLATNTVPFAAGDTVVGAPTSQYQQAGLNIYIGQSTASTGSYNSHGVMVDDAGPSQLTHAFQALNSTNNGVAQDMFDVDGSYQNDFYIKYRPANNGTILFVQGNEPVSSNQKPYNIFEDDASPGYSFGVDPRNVRFTLNQPLFVAGSEVCTAANGICGAGGGGTVTSVSVGTWPSWLTPTVTNATTAPGIAVAASAIPNAALANSATTVNGIVCTLGSTCTIPTGSTTPPLTYNYYPAAVSDGGSAFAGGFTRYNNNQPQTGSVNPASSALGYMLFQATPTAPQYAELTTTAPPYWTSSGMYLEFYSTAVTGNAVMDVQTACVTANQVVGSPTFSTAIVTTTAVSTTANGKVRTALIPNIAAPGANGCPATGMTTPTTLTIRVYADATSAVPVYLLGATLVTGRSQ